MSLCPVALRRTGREGKLGQASCRLAGEVCSLVGRPAAEASWVDYQLPLPGVFRRRQVNARITTSASFRRPQSRAPLWLQLTVARVAFPSLASYSLQLHLKMSVAVQTFGKKKTATAVAHATPGRGLVRLNGQPISLAEPALLRCVPSYAVSALVALG